MKKNLIAIIAILGFAGGAMAFDEGMDANGDGVMSMEEMTISYPKLTAEVLAAIDANNDGVVDAVEWDAAKEAGVL